MANGLPCVVTELLLNDERLLFYSASKLQKCGEGGESINWNIKKFLCSTFVVLIVQEILMAEKSCHLQAKGWDLNVSVDVKTVVFTGKNHTAIVHQSHVKALSVFNLEKYKSNFLYFYKISDSFVIIIISFSSLWSIFEDSLSL